MKTTTKTTSKARTNRSTKRDQRKIPMSLQQSLDALSPERKARVVERADELIAEEKALRELRAARAMSQVELATRLGVKQAEISKMERRTDMYLSTLRDYVEALGGSLHVVVEFPGIGTTRIKHLSSKWLGDSKPKR